MILPFELDRPLAFFDLETTGLSTASDRIVELAVIRISPPGDVLEAVRRFNPEMPIDPEATAVHGISNEDVADEPPFGARAMIVRRRVTVGLFVDSGASNSLINGISNRSKMCCTR